MNFPTVDPVVNRVLEKFVTRHEAGMLKYNVTMEANQLSTIAWITHAQEELMDGILYLERVKSDFEAAQDLTKLVPGYPTQYGLAEPLEQPDSFHERVWDGPELKQGVFP